MPALPRAELIALGVLPPQRYRRAAGDWWYRPIPHTAAPAPDQADDAAPDRSAPDAQRDEEARPCASER